MKYMIYLLLICVLIILLSCEKNDVIIEPSYIIRNSIDEYTVLLDRYTESDSIDYYVDSIVLIRSELIIEEGVILSFNERAGFKTVEEGFIVANGTKEKPIIFKGRQEIPSYWSGIEFGKTTNINVLNFCSFHHGGYIGDSSNNSVITVGSIDPYNNFQFFPYLSCTNVIIDQSNGYGLTVNTAINTVHLENIFIDVREQPAMKIPLHVMESIDSTIILNTTNEYLVEISGTLIYGEDFYWNNYIYGSPYIISGKISCFGIEDIWGNGNTPASLIISKGLNLKFISGGIFIYSGAHINALGTINEPITFTSLEKSTPQWYGIHLSSNDIHNELKYCNVSYGGMGYSEYNYNANISLHGKEDQGTEWPAYLKISNSTVSNSDGCGIFIGIESMLNETNNQFYNNKNGPICR